MKYNFRARRQNLIEKANKLSEKNETRSEALFEQAHKMAAMIPFGQPILVGYHSEKRHRRHANCIHAKLGKAFEAQDKAWYYSKRSDSMENSTVIFSDDPDAIGKLEIHLAGLIANHAFMKAANKYVKTKDNEGFLKLKGASAEIWNEITTDRFGFTGFGLASSNQNIKRVQRRIEDLKKMVGKETQETIMHNVRLVENVEANRVQMIFPARVSR
jgi:Domain of unknown function (DUF3560)